MFLTMAWRNIWRQKKRTLITVVALTFGVCGIVFMHSYGGGVWSEVVNIMTRTTLGHLQIHGNGYQTEPAIYNTVPDPVAVEADLLRLIPDAKPLRRVLGFGFGDLQQSGASAIEIDFFLISLKDVSNRGNIP